ncbi:hypothetical protein FQR65_LT16668 [Abscondita terminalis]|nr:hypothetical protein FQR65_LT16668 [Abscondita terminalis]
MKLTKELIKILAEDIMLEFTEEEIEEIISVEKNLISMFEEVKKISTEGVEEMHFPFEIENSYLREDEEVHELDGAKVLNNSPQSEDGYILINKSSLDELGMGGTGLYSNNGFVPNPLDETRICGGSSVGSAYAVAKKIVPFAIGTDTGDSIRKPASYVGIVGFKPTYGSISRYGVIPYSPSLDHVEAVSTSANLDGINFGNRVEGKNYIDVMKKTRTQGFGSIVKKRFLLGNYQLQKENQTLLLSKAKKIRRLIKNELDLFYKDLEILIIPPTQNIAPKIEDVLTKKIEDRKFGGSHFLQDILILGNFNGMPSITLPFVKQNNLPIGINLNAQIKNDGMLLSAALEVEKIISNFTEKNHVELKTKTKMFATASVTFGQKPNTKISAVDLGYPGAIPTVNRRGVDLAIRACSALKMDIDPLLRFDRKNYFYPDLAKGFQITQQFYPIGKDGSININLNGTTKEIEIERLHIEEDTAKQTHKDKNTFLDYNRSGIGLIEIVTKPVIRSADEAVAYVEKLREILLFLEVSDVKMSEGSLRCDINISLRPIGSKEFGNKVEIKNLNSLNNIKKSIEFEIKRQTKLIMSNKVVDQETRRFNESIQETVLMRKKDNAIDYKYFREPNIHSIRLEDSYVKKIIKESPELADIKREKYLNVYMLPSNEVDYLLSNLEISKFFEETIKLNKNYKKISNFLIGDIKNLLTTNNIEIHNSKLKPNDIAELIEFTDKGLISSKHVKSILPIVFNSDEKVIDIIERLNLKLISNENEIKKLLEPILKENKDLIENEYKTRPERVEKTLMGQLMKVSGGNVNPDISMEIILKLLK